MGTLIRTYKGSVIVNGFGFGVELSGHYTTADIFETAARNKPAEMLTYHPAVWDWKLYNSYIWIPWTRLHRSIGESIVNRCKMHTVSNHSNETASDYIGSGTPYLDSWMRYITTSDRLAIFSRFSKDLRNLRILDLGCAGGNNLLGLAAYGMDVYGVESHPELYNQRHYLLRDRIVFGDALECLGTFKAKSFDAVLVSCTGNIWWYDFPDFLISVSNLLVPGGLAVLDTLPHKYVTIKDEKLYKVAMKEVGLMARMKSENMLVGVKVR
jgi:SAM-dependent methyltransferase